MNGTGTASRRTAAVKRVIALFAVEWVFVEGVTLVLRYVYRHHLPVRLGLMSFAGLYEVVVLAIVAFAAAQWMNVSVRSYGFDRFGRRSLTYAFAAFSALFLVAFVSRIADPGFDAPYAVATGLMTWNGVGRFLLGLPLFLVAEEIFLRFFQVTSVELIGKRFAIVVVAVNFSILHYPFFSPVHAWSVLPSVFLGAVVLGVLFLLTRSIVLTLLVHVAYDAVIVVQTSLHARGDAVGEMLLWVAYGVCFVATATVAWRMLSTLWQPPRSLGLKKLVAGAFIAAVPPVVLLFFV